MDLVSSLQVFDLWWAVLGSNQWPCRLHELTDGWKPEVIARGNNRVLDWRESISRVEGAYPVYFFEISSEPSSIACLKYAFERCGVVESPSLLRHPIHHHSPRLEVRRTERLSQDTWCAAPEAESLWISRWPVARRLRRLGPDPRRPTQQRTTLASKVDHTLARKFTVNAKPRMRQPPRDGPANPQGTSAKVGCEGESGLRNRNRPGNAHGRTLGDL